MNSFSDAWRRIVGACTLSTADARRAIIKETAPAGLVLDKDPDLRGTSIRALPATLTVNDSLDLRECVNLSALPERLTVRGELLLNGCSAIGELPATLSVGWTIDASGCSSLRCIAEGFRTEWHLQLVGCRSLESLPEHLTVGGNLNIRNCRSLKSLPRVLSVGGNLTIEDCPNLERLPEKLWATNVSLINCNHVASGLGKLHVKGSLTIQRCDHLTLPEQLIVGEYLELRGQPLSRLPNGLSVGNDLNLDDCRNLSSLGQNLSVGGELSLRNCERLRSLDGLLSAGEIDVGGTQITTVPAHLADVPFRWRGVAVPLEFITNPERIQARDILNEANAERRRVMIERFGTKRFMNSVQAEIIHSDHDAGGERKLLRVPFEDDEPMVCLQVHCPSTGALYILRVPPNMRSCHEAAAWIAGFTNPDEYKLLQET